MTWIAPFTAVSGDVLTAAEYNEYVRDNMNETCVAKATVRNAVFAGNGLGQIAQRTPRWSGKTGGSTTTSTTYTDLADGVGPSITLTTGTLAAIWLYCNQYNDSGAAAWMAVEISGATSFGASDSWAVQQQDTAGDRVGMGAIFDNLTAGVNTFTAKYRVSTSGTGYFSQRRIAVWPF